MKEKIITYAKEQNIEICGFLEEQGRSIFVALFPYYTGPIKEIGIARYARLPDYHRVCKSYLERIGEYAKTLDGTLSYERSVDREGNPERYWAMRAGLGFIGRNHCLINPVYGSFVFIGALLFSKEIYGQIHCAELLSPCDSCGRCLSACPTGTLQQNDFSVCLSNISQQKQLSQAEHALLLQNPRVWGCDLCQNTCPYNRNPKLTPLLEFYQNQLDNLAIFQEISELSNREFQKNFQIYPFTWRGKKVIERNLNIYQTKKRTL